MAFNLTQRPFEKATGNAMTKTFKLKNDKAGFNGEGIDLCGGELDSVFPGACLNRHLTIVASTQRQHRRGEVKIKVNAPDGRVPSVEIDGRKIQILFTTWHTLSINFPDLREWPTLYIQMKFS